MHNIVHVAIPGSIFDYLDYLAPKQSLAIGQRVMVQLRNQQRLGLIVGFRQSQTTHYKLSPILELIDQQPIICKDLLKLAQWIADYYQSPLSEVLKAILPKKLRQAKPACLPTVRYYQIKPNHGLTLSKQAKKQQTLLSYLEKNLPKQSHQQLKAQGFNLTTINQLIEKGYVECQEQPLSPEVRKIQESPLKLNAQQTDVVHTINQSLHQFKAYLLFGITGSGKTEVYFHVMQQIIQLNKQVLILVPEIGLTPQFVSRLERRFKVPIALLHSSLNDGERLTNWLWSKDGQARILIGTRSAIFTPMPELGLVIVDEEHDLSFKQQDGSRFSARDIALKRGFDSKVPVILGSATPSLESLYNVEQGKYQLLKLSQRAATTEDCYYRIADLRNQQISDGLCAISLQRIEAHLAQNKQVMVFINRRGFAPILICHQCGKMTDCPHCSAHLTVHFEQHAMRCHHCGFKRAISSQCESCYSPELIPLGVGTERLANYLSQKFSQYKVLRIDRDTTKGKGKLKDSLQAVDAGAVDILVGTQLLAKGHHFKKLSLVIIIDADSGLYSQDFRATERLGQIITQVAGRAGREGGGEVIIQTHQPDNPLLNTLIQKGYTAFSQQLLTERRNYLWPPYSYLALCRAKAKQPQKVYDFFNTVKAQLHKLEPSLTLLGPAPAPMEKKAGQFQLQLLIRSPKRPPLLGALKALRTLLRSKASQKLISSLQFTIDVDPQDLS